MFDKEIKPHIHEITLSKVKPRKWDVDLLVQISKRGVELERKKQQFLEEHEYLLRSQHFTP